MKKNNFLLTVLVFVVFTNLALFSQNITFKDPNFKKGLLEHRNPTIDRNFDGEISYKEAENTIEIKIDNRLNLLEKIKFVDEIVYFKKLQKLDLRYNSIQNIDLTKLTNLTHLNLNDNFLKKIDLTKNIKLNQLNLNGNSIQNINLTKNIKLRKVDIRNNKIPKINITKNVNLTELKVSRNKLQNIDVTKNKELNLLFIDLNKIQNIDITKNSKLEYLDVNSNKLQNIDVTKNSKLERLDVSFNNIKNIDVTKNTNLKSLDVRIYNLPSIDLTKNIELKHLDIMSFEIQNIDLSNCKIQSLTILDCKKLKTLNLTNQPLRRVVIRNNKNLKLVCANKDQVNSFDNKIKDKGRGNNGNFKMSTSCTQETLNTIIGKVRYAQNGDCSNSNSPFTKLRLNIIGNKGERLVIFPDAKGNYKGLVTKGTYRLLPVLIKSNYFKITSTNTNPIVFKQANDVISKNFCVSPKGEHNDLAINIIGDRTRPGFNTTYIVEYTNNGTTTLSGAINLTFDNTKQTFVSSTLQNSINNGNITWNFSNLKPLETKKFTVTFNINKPTDNPPVNGGDYLQYVATITPNNNIVDENTNDNTATLNQEVRNSWDPNDITCTEGKLLRPKNVGKYLHYLIRFENKGTDNATNIRVENVIDSTKFDLKTFTPITGSHSFNTEIKKNKINFKFNNINLPFDDANNDGYVYYKIKTLPNLKEGTKIDNQAAIYFDYNKPVITNIETVTIKKEVIKNAQFSDFFTLTPNPTAGPLKLIEKKPGVKISHFTVYDQGGNMVDYLPGNIRTFDYWFLNDNEVHIMNLHTEKHGILSTKFLIKR